MSITVPIPPIPLNMTWTKGTPFSFTFVMRDASGRRLPLARYSAAMHIRTNATDTAPLAVLTRENGHIALDAASGDVTVALSTAEILGISWATALYDLLLIDPLGREERVYTGTITVATGITRVEASAALPTTVTLITPVPPVDPSH